EDRHAYLAEHLDAAAGVEQGHVLRGGDNDGAADRHRLRQAELDVAGTRRHVDDQEVELAPHGVVEDLVEGTNDHRSTPDHSLVVIYEETDRVALQSVRGDGFHLVAI